jgi:hypothetical protein
MKNISILSQTSVDKLRTICSGAEDILALEFEDLCIKHQLETISSGIDFDDTLPLKMPQGISQETNSDLENCIQIVNILPKLNDIQATDERLWTTLCLREFKSYSLERWPYTTRTNPSQHRLNHWFARNIRGRMRNNAVGRLWWYQRLCSRISDKPLFETLDQLFFNSDYRSQMLERNTSSAITAVVSVILKITEEQKIKGIYFNRDKFRNFMKRVDLLAGRSRLAVLDETQLKERLEKLYLEAYS